MPSDRVAERELTEIIDANSHLVLKIANSFLGRGLPWEDLVAEGNIGIILAARHYQPARQVKFSTYCCWWIRQAIQKAVEDHGQPMRIPRKTLAVIRRIAAVRRHLTEEAGAAPDAADVAAAAGLQLPIVEKYLPLVTLTEMPFNVSVADTAGEEPETLAGDGLPPPDEENMQAEARAGLAAKLQRLTPRQQAVINRRFGLDGRPAATLRELAEERHCSIEAVRKIQNQALKKLKNLYERSE